MFEHGNTSARDAVALECKDCSQIWTLDYEKLKDITQMVSVSTIRKTGSSSNGRHGTFCLAETSRLIGVAESSTFLLEQ